MSILNPRLRRGPFSMRFAQFNPLQSQYTPQASLTMRGEKGLTTTLSATMRNTQPTPFLKEGFQYNPALSFGANFNKRFEKGNLNLNINVDPKGPQKVSAGIRYTF
tara:strand:- start:4 stop:321 length:318 start_codon:yes stop_codon:yes gene_type:complete